MLSILSFKEALKLGLKNQSWTTNNKNSSNEFSFNESILEAFEINQVSIFFKVDKITQIFQLSFSTRR
jgi:hypothetical protein